MELSHKTMGKTQTYEILLMNGISNSKKEQSYSTETDDHQLPGKEQQSNDKEKKIKDVESPSGFSTMSPLQKFFFVLSLLLSVLYVVAFAWLIPCKVPDADDNTEPIVVTEGWKLNFPQIDISTSLISTKELKNGSLLLFGYESIEDYALSGLISIRGDEGKMHWKKPLSFVPRYIFCDNLQVGIDSNDECIMIGDNGSIAIFSQATETLTWMKTSTNSAAYEAISVPAVIPDCDSDGTRDLVVAYSEFSSSDGRFPDSVSVEILSGHTGNVIGFRKPVTECTSTVNKLQLWKKDGSSDVLIYCDGNDGFGNIWKISTDNLCSAASEEKAQLIFETIYRIEKPKHKQLNVLYQPIKNLYSPDEDMLVAWTGGNIIHLTGDNDVTWSYSANTSAEIRALLIGQFTNESDNQVAMINSDRRPGTMLTILQAETGNKLKSTLYPEYFITEVIPLQNIFYGLDGILMKHTKVKSKVTVKDSSVYNNSSADGQPLEKFVIQEEYLIGRPGCTDNESLRFVMSEKVTKFLQRNSTNHNRIEYSSIKAAVRNSHLEDSLELYVVSTTSSIPTEKNSVSQGININKSTTVKLLHLSHTLFTRNNTCECSC